MRIGETTFTGIIVAIALISIGYLIFTPPTKAAEALNQSDYATYDLNSDGCILREEVDTVLEILAPEATTVVDSDEYAVFTSPNQPKDMAVEFGEDGCATGAQLIEKSDVAA